MDKDWISMVEGTSKNLNAIEIESVIEPLFEDGFSLEFIIRLNWIESIGSWQHDNDENDGCDHQDYWRNYWRISKRQLYRNWKRIQDERIFQWRPILDWIRNKIFETVNWKSMERIHFDIRKITSIFIENNSILHWLQMVYINPLVWCCLREFTVFFCVSLPKYL